MVRKLLTALFVFIIAVSAIPLAVSAEVAPPASLGAPEHFGANRYALDLRNCKQSGYADSSISVGIYSPFSNVISNNMPVWSNASQWATGEVQKAVENGLYPEKLQGADLTRPITRAEFAAVALKLYEALSGSTTSPAPTNTFTDTKDTDILKAYALDIVAGVGNNKFAPDEYVNREQAATMLTRVLQLQHTQDAWASSRL